MSVSEALKGASVELAGLPPLQKLSTALRIGRTIAGELAGTVLQIPYGIRAYRTYQSLSTLEAPASVRQRAVTLVKDLRYSDDAERCVMDVYLPPEGGLRTEQSGSGNQSSAAPVALFCHGGVWASGSKWHYAPMATRLAQAGVIVGVMQYSLYPQAMVPQMIAEVGGALSWTMDNIDRFGGSSDKVTLMGHSAGAHLCAMALLQRSCAGKKDSLSDDQPDLRMPCQFLGMSGVYDISHHYEYEDGRGVAKLSTMARVVGGHRNFAQMSPSAILARAVHGPLEDPTDRRTPPLHGERISARMGLNHNTHDPLPPTSAGDFVDPLVDFSLANAANLPPMFIMSGVQDSTVPWYESSEFCVRLRDVGVPSKKLVYKGADHGVFVVGWRPVPQGNAMGPRQAIDDLPEPCQDILRIVSDGSDGHYFPRSASSARVMQMASSMEANAYGFEKVEARGC